MEDELRYRPQQTTARRGLYTFPPPPRYRTFRKATVPVINQEQSQTLYRSAFVVVDALLSRRSLIRATSPDSDWVARLILNAEPLEKFITEYI
jgi:hypothetical protein